MMPRVPYPVSGTVTDVLGAVVSGGTVKVTYHGDEMTFTTNSAGQYIIDLANLPIGNDYAVGGKFLVAAYNSTQNFFKSSVQTVGYTGSCDLDIVLDPVNRANMHTLVQKLLWNILYTDTTIFYWIPDGHLVDQIPSDLMKGVGFPYIIVNSPTIVETVLTLGPSRKSLFVIKTKIDIFDRKPMNIRYIADAITNSLRTNLATSRKALVFWSRTSTEELRSTVLPFEDTYPVWTLSQTIEMKWYG